jgi:hypothetical protein
MLRGGDIELGQVAETFRLAADSAQNAQATQQPLPLDKRSTLKLDWHHREQTLDNVARELERWQESELAEEVREVRALGHQLFDALPSDGQGVPRFCEAARRAWHRLIDLQRRLAALDPVADPTFESIDGQSGVAVALVFRISKELRVKIRRLVCGHLRGTPAVWLSHADFCHGTDVDAERPGRRNLLCVDPDDPRRLLDEREQDLFSPQHRHRYEVYYYLIPGDDRRLDLLLRIAWGLASLAPKDSRTPEPVRFWMCAAPAVASYCGTAQVREADAIFDHLSRIVREEKLMNCLLVPLEMLPAPDIDRRGVARARGLGRWFAPAWRVPYQHRRDIQSNVECLWSTASFGGLPGEDLPTEVVRGGDPLEPECWTPDHSKEESSPARSYCRAAARLLPRRAVSCRLQLGSQELLAYLVDYSALGCRLLLPKRGMGWAEMGKLEAVVHLPAGLPWPWEPKRALSEQHAPASMVGQRVWRKNEALYNERAKVIVGGDGGNALEVTFRFLWGTRESSEVTSAGSS